MEIEYIFLNTMSDNLKTMKNSTSFTEEQSKSLDIALVEINKVIKEIKHEEDL